MSRPTIPGQVIGKAAGSLTNSKSWLDNVGTAKVGAVGERATAAVLNRLALSLGGPSVIHDLRIPIPGVKANILMMHICCADERRQDKSQGPNRADVLYFLADTARCGHWISKHRVKRLGSRESIRDNQLLLS